MDTESVWQDVVPDSVLLQIFGNLRPWSLQKVSQVCKRWHRIAQDESLWRNFFFNSTNWEVKGPVSLKGDSWYSEYKRLYYHTPTQLSERFEGHLDEVLDVTFSHDGTVFCTTSKDATVKIWEVGCPTVLKYTADLGLDHSWNLTQYAAFNKTDTLLLVCGVQIPLTEDFNQYASPLGLGAVFRMTDFQLLQIMPMDPPHLFADWFDENICVGGYINSTGDDARINIRAFKVDMKGGNPKTAVDGPLVYSFHGNTHHTMNILVASVPTVKTKNSKTFYQKHETEKGLESPTNNKKDIQMLEDSLECFHFHSIDEENVPVSNQLNENVSDNCSAEEFLHNEISKLSCTRKKESNSSSNNRAGISSQCGDDYKDSIEPPSEECHSSCQAEFDKYMVFVTGKHDTLAFHKVNDLNTRLDNGLLKLEAWRKESTGSDCNTPGRVFLQDSEEISKIIHLPGCYICGLSLSPDHRYLFFNFRLQLQDEVDGNGYPRLLEGIKLRTIDLQTFHFVPEFTFKGHKATSDIPAWYICLDSCTNYIASGSEEALGYLWDKHYKIILAQYRHGEGVVNGVSFNPLDNECLATVADDKIINVWRSRNRQKERMQKRVTEGMDFT